MKIKQIKNINQLPPAFSLDKYKSTIDFDIADWVVNLEYRFLSQYMVGRPSDWYVSEIKVRSAAILDDPIWWVTSIDDFINSGGFSKPALASNVQDFEVRDFYFHSLGDSRYEAYMDGVDAYANPDSPVFGSLDAIQSQEMEARMAVPYYRMMEDCGIPHLGDLIVKVDLHGTDQKIISDFTKWLSSTREKVALVAPRKKITKDDFLIWIKNAILPYLDLIAWSNANGVEITQQLLGTALFPDEYDVNLAERIRKVVAPMARTIAQDIFISSLRSQAISEIAERKSQNSIPVSD